MGAHYRKVVRYLSALERLKKEIEKAGIDEKVTITSVPITDADYAAIDARIAQRIMENDIMLEQSIINASNSLPLN